MLQTQDLLDVLDLSIARNLRGACITNVQQFAPAIAGFKVSSTVGSVAGSFESSTRVKCFYQGKAAEPYFMRTSPQWENAISISAANAEPCHHQRFCRVSLGENQSAVL